MGKRTLYSLESDIRRILEGNDFISTSDEGGKQWYMNLVTDLANFVQREIEKAREEGDIASDFLYWHPLGGGMPDSSIRIGVEFEVGGCYEDWGFVIEQNGRTISSGRTLKEAISKLKDSK